MVRGDRVLASLEVAESPASRMRGLLGRASCEGALLIRPARSAHTLGMRFPLDVAYLDAELRVVRTVRMDRHRLGLPVRGGRAVLEAEAGCFERWGLQVGDELAVRCDGDPTPAGADWGTG